MKIKKILQIKDVGRLEDCKPTKIEFKKWNFLFGGNGRGKTTLCAVLRSLQTGRPEPLVERRTLPHNGTPKASILMSSGTATFNGESWSCELPELAIFDSAFVDQNVYVGDYVARHQRESLFRVVVGTAGVKLSEKVERCRSLISKAQAQSKWAKAEIERAMPHPMDFDEFIDLKSERGLDKKIVAKNAEIRAANEHATAVERGNLSELKITQLPSDIENVLGKSLPGLAAEAGELLTQHLQEHNMEDGGLEWAIDGIKYAQGETCPFCAQGIANNDIVDAYKRCLSSKYEDLVADIDKLRDNVANAFGDATLRTMRKEIDGNIDLARYWEKLGFDANVDEIDFDNAIASPIEKWRTVALSLVEAKRSRPLINIELDDEYRAAVANIDRVLKLMTSYNQNVGVANKKGDKWKERMGGINLPAAQSELNRLTLCKHRQTTETMMLCDRYRTLKSREDTLKAILDATKKNLDTVTVNIMGKYQDRINEILTKFGATFSICKTKREYQGTTPSIIYQIRVNGEAVKLGDQSTKPGTHSFRTTLSSGDKSTLALAFFIALVEEELNFGTDKIVVFDDPLSSLDSSRQDTTVRQVIALGERCSQIFILSHHEKFLFRIYSKVRDACSRKKGEPDIRTLELARVGDRSSGVEDWDIEYSMLPLYYKEHDMLITFLKHGKGNKREIAQKLRSYLERQIRWRMPEEFRKKESLGKMIAEIAAKGEGHPLHKFIAELDEINEYATKYCHGDQPGQDTDAEPDSGELTGKVETVMRLLI